MTEPEETPKKQRVFPRDASGKRVPTSKLVEAARAMLGQNMTPGDIKRTFASTYRMRPRSFERYIALARKRNRESIGRSSDEAKSDSVTFWSSKLQTSERTLALSQRRLSEAQKRIDQSNSTIDDPSALDEQREAAQIAIEACTKQCETLRLQMNRAQADSFFCQQQVDRLVGNHAPIKHSQTSVDGTDAPQVPATTIHICEPSSMESAQLIISQILTALPAGWYIANERGNKLLADGRFENEPDVLLLPPTGS